MIENSSIKLFKSEKINDWFNFINSHVSLIILIPTLLGGIWQIAALANMSLSFIRFFSITQLLSDGLIILILLLTWIVMGYIIYRIFKNSSITKEGEEYKETLYFKIKNTKYISRKRIAGYICLLLFIAACYFIGNELRYFYDSNEFTYFQILSIPLLAAGLFIIVLLIFLIQSFLFDVDFEKNNTRGGFILGFFIIVLAFVALSMLGHFFINFNKSFFLPSNVENVKNILCQLQKENSSKSIEIAYTNDQYIFVKHGKLIKIYKFEELFNSKPCHEDLKPSDNIELFLKKTDSIERVRDQKFKSDSIKIDNKIKRLDSLKSVLKQLE